LLNIEGTSQRCQIGEHKRQPGLTTGKVLKIKY